MLKGESSSRPVLEKLSQHCDQDLSISAANKRMLDSIAAFLGKMRTAASLLTRGMCVCVCVCACMRVLKAQLAGAGLLSAQQHTPLLQPTHKLYLMESSQLETLAESLINPGQQKQHPGHSQLQEDAGEGIKRLGSLLAWPGFPSTW